MGWPVGHVYARPQDGRELLVSSGIWYLARAGTFDALVAISARASFPPGIGLPGRVLAGGRPVWIMDVTRDDNYPRAASAAELAVRAGLAFPVMIGARVEAVLEFYSEEAVPPDLPLLDVMGDVGLLLGRVIERGRANRALMASERRFRSVTQSANDAIVSADDAGAIVSWNHGAEVMFGYQESEMLGARLERIIPERYREPHRAGMERFRQSGEARVIGRTVELVGVRKGGVEFPLELSLASWRNGADFCFSAIIRDITARRHDEERLRDFARELDRKNSELALKNEALERSRDELMRSHEQARQIFSALAEVLPGAELDGKYRLHERIGSGGFGVVYRAEHLALRRPVAVKVFRPREHQAPDDLARFRLEGMSACRVQHPNAVYVLDAGVSAANIAYLVMELLEGETLAALIARPERLPVRRVLQLAKDVASVLATAHATGIIHRDIKPDNVFLHRPPGRAGKELVKVLDFGIAKLVEGGRHASAAGLTGTGQVLGTPTYMSPERVRSEPYDGRADVYSLGVMLYELVAGRPPFSSASNNAWEVVKAHLDERPEPLDTHLPEAPPALVELVARCLSKAITKRPTAAELATELDALIAACGDDDALMAAASATSQATTPLASFNGNATEDLS
jgi:PAS domain S-box-containing protein